MEPRYAVKPSGLKQHGFFWALPIIVFPSAVESRYVSLIMKFFTPAVVCQLDGVQLCELTPVIFKITDS
jgi:hypothetical protein